MNYKHLFNLPKGHHYLNCAYLSPLLRCVEKAGMDGILAKSKPWEIKPEHFFEDSDELRKLFADLIHAEHPEQIAILPSVSYGMSIVAKNLSVVKGDEILITGEQFPSNVYPWRDLCRAKGCDLRVVDPPVSRNRGEEWNKQILSAITEKTALVAIGNVHWTDGTLFDIQQISDKAHENGALFVIDGTQSVGALPIDVQKVKPDALICAGYKWLMGPYGITLGYFSPKLTDGNPLEEGWIVRKKSRDFSRLIDYEDEYEPGAIRFDVGQRSNFITVPMMKEALKQVNEWGTEYIQDYAEKLTKDLVDQLKEEGFRIEDSRFRGHHLFGVRLPDEMDMNSIQSRLAQNNIHVSVRGSAIRISTNVFNTEDDILALKQVLLSSEK